MFCDGFQINHPCINKELYSKTKNLLVQKLKSIPNTKEIKNILIRPEVENSWITFYVRDNQLTVELLDNMVNIQEQMREFALHNWSFNQQQIDAIVITKIDSSVNLSGTFCSFNIAED